MTTLRDFMNSVWKATYINGYGEVQSKRVMYGSLPDIQFTVLGNEGEILISAKWMFENNVTFQ